MGQRSICLFLAMKRLSVQAIYDELVAVLGPDAIGYPRSPTISVNGTSHLLFAKPLHAIHWDFP
jgi:hypothetical protein